MNIPLPITYHFACGNMNQLKKRHTFCNKQIYCNLQQLDNSEILCQFYVQLKYRAKKNGFYQELLGFTHLGWGAHFELPF